MKFTKCISWQQWSQAQLRHVGDACHLPLVEAVTGGADDGWCASCIVFSNTANLLICKPIILQISKFANLQTRQTMEDRQANSDVDNIDWVQAVRFRFS